MNKCSLVEFNYSMCNVDGAQILFATKSRDIASHEQYSTNKKSRKLFNDDFFLFHNFFLSNFRSWLSAESGIATDGAAQPLQSKHHRVETFFSIFCFVFSQQKIGRSDQRRKHWTTTSWKFTNQYSQSPVTSTWSCTRSVCWAGTCSTTDEQWNEDGMKERYYVNSFNFFRCKFVTRNDDGSTNFDFIMFTHHRTIFFFFLMNNFFLLGDDFRREKNCRAANLYVTGSHQNQTQWLVSNHFFDISKKNIFKRMKDSFCMSHYFTSSRSLVSFFTFLFRLNDREWEYTAYRTTSTTDDIEKMTFISWFSASLLIRRKFSRSNRRTTKESWSQQINHDYALGWICGESSITRSVRGNL